MPRKHNAYFEPQKIMDSQLLYLIFEHNMESQHQRTLAFLDGTSTTSLWVLNRTWVEMDVQKSVMKNKKW